MDGSLVNKLKRWFEDLTVDGWVEADASGNMHIELFAIAAKQLNLKPGDYVRIQVMRKETQDAPETRSAVTP